MREGEREGGKGGRERGWGGGDGWRGGREGGRECVCVGCVHVDGCLCDVGVGMYV